MISDLVEIRGPSALGGGWRRGRDLLYLMAVAEFRRSYLGTALGYLWSFARPLMLFGVLLLVFTQAFDLGERVQQYPVLLLFNIVLFGFFQEATVLAVGSIVASEPIVRRTQFPRLVIPLSVVLTSLFTLAANLVVVFVFILVAGVEPRWTWLLLPVIVAALTVFTTAVSMVVSALNPRFRDTGIIWSVAVTALFYATPVLYPLEIVPGMLGRLLALSPLAPIFELARKWPGGGCGRRRLAAHPGRALHRRVRGRRLDLQPRGAADRRGALNTHARCTRKLSDATTRMAVTRAATSGSPATSTKKERRTTPSATAEPNTSA